MNKREKELLETAKLSQENKEPDVFKAWLRGFRLPGDESEELKKELDKLLEK